MADHDHYRRILMEAFPYVLTGSAEDIRRAAAELLKEEPDFAAGGSSFAVVARPRWALYLSEASADRLSDADLAQMQGSRDS